MEEIKQIPEGWEIDSISKLCDIVDYRGKTPEKVDMGTFLVTAKNIRNGKIDYNISKEYVKTEKYEEIMSRGLPKIGDVLITTEAPLGEVASIDNESIALAQRIIKLRGKREKLENKYLKYYMLSKEFQKEIKNDATGSTVEGIKGSRLKKKIIKFPKSKKEQLVISNILEKIDQNIEKTEQIIEKYRKIKSGLMDDLLTGKIRIKDGKWVKETEFKEVEGVGRIPKDWEVKELKEIIKIYYGKDQKSVQDNVNGRYPILGTGGQIGKSVEYLYNKPSVLIGRKGTIDKPRYIEEPFWTVDTLFYTEIYGNYVPKWVYYALKLINLNIYNEATGVPSLNPKTIYKIKLSIPSKNEQKHITKTITKQDQLIEKEEQYLEKLKKLKAGLMEDLLTGKVRVKIEE